MEYKIVFFDGTTRFVNIELPPDVSVGNVKVIYPNRSHEINVLSNQITDKKFVSVVYVDGRATIYNSKEHDGLKVYTMSIEKAKNLGIK